MERVARRRIERKDRAERIHRHKEKIDMLKAIVLTLEDRGKDEDISEVRRLKVRIRTLEQQVRYIGELYDEAKEQLHALYTR